MFLRKVNRTFIRDTEITAYLQTTDNGEIYLTLVIYQILLESGDVYKRQILITAGLFSEEVRSKRCLLYTSTAEAFSRACLADD